MFSGKENKNDSKIEEPTDPTDKELQKELQEEHKRRKALYNKDGLFSDNLKEALAPEKEFKSSLERLNELYENLSRSGNLDEGTKAALFSVMDEVIENSMKMLADDLATHGFLNSEQLSESINRVQHSTHEIMNDYFRLPGRDLKG